MTSFSEQGHRTKIFVADAIETMSAAQGDALAVVGERIVAVGPRLELARQFPRAEQFDIGANGVIVPGFIDAHMHPSSVAEETLHLQLAPLRIRDADGLAQVLREYASSLVPGGWVCGFGYDPVKSTGGRVIDRDFLDRVCPSNPVLVVHVASHWAIANSAALELAGLSEESSDPPGGSLGHDSHGRLNGVVYEQAMFDFMHPALARGETIVPQRSLDDRVMSLGRVLDGFHAAGLTTVVDALASPNAIQLFQESEDRGALTMRIGFLVAYQHFQKLLNAGVRQSFGGSRLKLLGIKAFVDGAVGGGTCLLHEAYSNAPDSYGQQVLSDNDLLELVILVHDAGYALGVHANGDRAIELLLDCLEHAQATSPRPGIRHRIEHCSVINDNILKRMRDMRLVAVPFAGYVKYHGNALRDLYGSDRLERMFAHRSFIDAGVLVAGSSDYPCAPFEPLYGIESCITRSSEAGRPIGARQRITAREALALFTVNAAEAIGEECDRGRLLPGYLADFTVLSRNPVQVPPDEISDIDVLSTWVGGEQVWSAARR